MATEERRKSQRVLCNIPSSLRDFDSVTSWVSQFASIKDISSGGLRIRTHASIRMPDRLGFSFQLPDRESPIEAKAIPAWISEIRKTNIFNIGVRFIEISDEDRAAIESFVGKESTTI